MDGRALAPSLFLPAFLAWDGVELLPYKWQAWRLRSKLQPAAAAAAGPRAALQAAWCPSSPACPPQPGPSAASSGASCSAAAASALAPACPACGSPTEVGQCTPCLCVCPWEPQTLPYPSYGTPASPGQSVLTAGGMQSLPAQAVGRTLQSLPGMCSPLATRGRSLGERQGEGDRSWKTWPGWRWERQRHTGGETEGTAEKRRETSAEMDRERWGGGREGRSGASVCSQLGPLPRADSGEEGSILSLSSALKCGPSPYAPALFPLLPLAAHFAMLAFPLPLHPLGSL